MNGPIVVDFAVGPGRIVTAPDRITVVPDGIVLSTRSRLTN